jgi:hypothetical protein
MDMDMTGLWSWTVPLWGLGVLVFALAAVLMGPVNILTHVPTSVTEVAIPMKGGGSMLTTGQGGGQKSRTH